MLDRFLGSTSIIRWAVWYDDGSSFTSADGAPHEAPRWGVLCIAEMCRDHGRMIWHATDYYVWADERRYIAVSFVLACLMAVGLFARPY